MRSKRSNSLATKIFLGHGLRGASFRCWALLIVLLCVRQFTLHRSALRASPRSIDADLPWFENGRSHTVLRTTKANEIEDGKGMQTETNHPRNITVGLVANEFFDPSIGRTGGFGMATNMVGKFFRSHPNLHVNIVFVFSSPKQGTKEIGKVIHHKLLGWPLISMSTDPGARTLERATAALKEQHIDVFLTIDYRKDYDKVFSILPDVPIVLWARDPRTRAQITNLEGIRHPDFPNKRPKGVKAPLATNARSVWMKKEGLDDGPDSVLKDPRRFLIGVVWMPALYERLKEAYDIPPEENAMPLPNIVEGCRPEYIRKSETPVVIFVGRLDPYKRPWLLIELAYLFPDVEFWVLGRGHFPESYDINKDNGRPVPSNVKLLGQETGDAKWERLGAAWFLLSTSAHEGLAISYLEALTCETPVLSTVDPGEFVSRFGVFAGEFKGSGMDGLPSLREGFDKLLSNHTFREEKGRLGREHVANTHNEKKFFEGFNAILARLGLETRSATSMTTIGAGTKDNWDNIENVTQVTVKNKDKGTAEGDKRPDNYSRAQTTGSGLESQISIVILTMDEDRYEDLENIVRVGCNHRLVEEVVIIWNDPSRPHGATQLEKKINFTDKIRILKSTKNSLNNRYDPDFLKLRTGAVMILDDDMTIIDDTITCAHESWMANKTYVHSFGEERVVSMDNNYTTITEKGSRRNNFSLPRMIFGTALLNVYYDPSNADIRSYVDTQEGHCDDIAFTSILTKHLGKPLQHVVSPHGFRNKRGRLVLRGVHENMTGAFPHKAKLRTKALSKEHKKEIRIQARTECSRWLIQRLNWTMPVLERSHCSYQDGHHIDMGVIE